MAHHAMIVIDRTEFRRAALQLAIAELRATGEAGIEGSNVMILLEQLADEYPEVATPDVPQR